MRPVHSIRCELWSCNHTSLCDAVRDADILIHLHYDYGLRSLLTAPFILAQRDACFSFSFLFTCVHCADVIIIKTKLTLKKEKKILRHKSEIAFSLCLSQKSIKNWKSLATVTTSSTISIGEMRNYWKRTTMMIMMMTHTHPTYTHTHIHDKCRYLWTLAWISIRWQC